MRSKSTYPLTMAVLIVLAVSAFVLHYSARPVGTAQVGTTEQVVCE